MSVKKDMMAEVEAKAKRIREKRIVAANNKSLEEAVFTFFRHIDECCNISGPGYDPYLFSKAREALEQRMSGFDPGGKISIEFNVSEDLRGWEQQQVRGVTLWWSNTYILKNSVEPSYFIDLNQMLFI